MLEQAQKYVKTTQSQNSSSLMGVTVPGHKESCLVTYVLALLFIIKGVILVTIEVCVFTLDFLNFEVTVHCDIMAMVHCTTMSQCSY